MIELSFDGACEPNPGGAMSYGVYMDRDGKTLWSEGKVIPLETYGQATNNIAEYAGLKAGLEYLIENKLTDEMLIVSGDSKLVLEQMFGTWQIRKGAYVKIAKETARLLTRFRHVMHEWVPREKNIVADALSMAALEAIGVFRQARP
jgi:ribonuclease HI